MIQTQKIGKKPHFGLDLGLLGPNSDQQFFLKKIWLHQSLDIIVIYRHVQHQKKLIFQSYENLVTDGQIDGQADRRTRVIHKTLSN